MDGWLAHPIPVEADEEPVQSDPIRDLLDGDDGIDLARVERAVRRWEELGRRKGNGDCEMWILSQELGKANVPRHLRKVLLSDAARRSTSPDDRRRQAERMMRTHW